jgi:hypothetical protein
MKKTIIAVLMLAILSVSALAGSIEDLDYKDKDCNVFHCEDKNRQVDDYNVNVDADTVNGRDVTDEIDDLNHEVNHVERKVNYVDFKTNMNTIKIWRVNKDVNALEETVKGNSIIWSEDKKGIGTSKLSKYMVGYEGLFNEYNTFMDYFVDKFSELFESTSYYERIEELEERNRLLLVHIQKQDERITALENN